MKIPLSRMKDAKEKICPFDFNGQNYPMPCKIDHCMSWTLVRDQSAFEDHSGGKERAKKLAKCYNVLAERNNVRGSEGLWMVGPLGYCKRLWPMADQPDPSEYERDFDPANM